MCGIAGVVNTNGEPVDEGLLRRMTDIVAHRGPDGQGHYARGPVGLGHRRLAVIDLSSAGRQPMHNETGDMTIVYNGEVYNFQDIRKDLERRGHRFRSRTDSEVVLHAYEEWGEQCLDLFNGLFAFAIWDNTRQELFLARDRYGIKPLYFSCQAHAFIFASEQKSILVHPAVRRELDFEALMEYFTFQNIITDRTLLKGIQLFPAGCWARVSANTKEREPRPVRYWDFSFEEPDSPVRDEEYREELDRLFCRAVDRQLVSDVDVGCYLSGGMDSGSITAIAAMHLPYIRTFTCGFDLHSASGLELSFDERERAEMMSYLFKTEHYEMVLKAGDMERVFPQVAWHLEEPRVGQSYPNYYVAQLASKFVKVCLSGGGGDELFGGYPWRYYRTAESTDFEDYIDKYYVYWHRLIPNREIRTVFAPVWDEVKHVWTRDIFRDVFQSRTDRLTRPEDYINHSFYFEAKTFLHGLLVVEDKLSMAHGLEIRVPFLDNDLVDFAMRVPVRLKLKSLGQISRLNENEPGHKTARYYRKTRDGKLLLRRVMENYIPAEVTDATKQGFSAPDASWFKGDSIAYVRRLLLDEDAALYNYLDRRAVHDLVQQHLNGEQNRRLLIWSLLSFEWWLRLFLAGEWPPADAPC